MATLPVPAYGTLPGNLFSLAAQSFATGVGGWGASTNTASISTSSAQVLEGTASLTWAATASGSNSWVLSSAMTAVPNQPYVASGWVWLPAGSYACLAVDWYNGSTYTAFAGTTVAAPAGGGWAPVQLSFVMPATAVSFQLGIEATPLAAGTVFYADLMYLAQSEVQVLADWTSPVFTGSQPQYATLADLTPFVNVDLNPIAITRGRQDSVSDVQAGQLSLTLDNRTGLFTQGAAQNIYALTVGTRVQVNMSYQSAPGVYAAFQTRFDGGTNELDYTIATTGGDAQVSLQAKDVIGYLSQAGQLGSWTKQAVLLDDPLYHWTLDETSSGIQTAAETSGNNGPNLVANPTSTVTSGTFGGSGGPESRAAAASNAVGPYDSPISGWYQSQVPTVTSGAAGAGSAPLTARLPIPLSLSSTQSWSIEWWASPDTAASANWATANTAYMGMFTLGDNAGSHLQSWFQTASGGRTAMAMYYQANPWGGTPVSTSLGTGGNPWNASVAVPIHHVVTWNGSVFQFWVNGASVGTVGAPAGTGGISLQQLTVGSLEPTRNGYAGSIFAFSIYMKALNATQVGNHYEAGQLGNYGLVSGVQVQNIAQYAGVPAYWIGSVANGLTQTDYFPLGGQSPLSAMQEAEHAELGLLYANAAGKLSFASRATRMGITGTGVTLPQGSYQADMGLTVTEQYLQTSTAITGGANNGVATYQSPNLAQVGPYPNGDSSTPNTVYVPTTAPARLTQFQAQPYAIDQASWSVLTNDTPPLKVASVTLDVLTQVKSSSEYIAPSVVAGIDINQSITLANTDGVAAMPTALDFFVEGVTESYDLNSHTIQLYTSPVAPWRAWSLGSAAYGALDNTAILGISQEPGVGGTGNITTAQTPGVDAGGPWYPGTFAAGMNQGETSGNGFVGVSDIRGLSDTLNSSLNGPVTLVGSPDNTGLATAASTWLNLPTNVVTDTHYLSRTGNYVYADAAGWYEAYLNVRFNEEVLGSSGTAPAQLLLARAYLTDTRLGYQYLLTGNASLLMPASGATTFLGKDASDRIRIYMGAGSRLAMQVYTTPAFAVSSWLIGLRYLGSNQTLG